MWYFCVEHLDDIIQKSEAKVKIHIKTRSTAFVAFNKLMACL